MPCFFFNLAWPIVMLCEILVPLIHSLEVIELSIQQMKM